LKFLSILISSVLLAPTSESAANPANSSQQEQAPIELAARYKGAYVQFPELDNLILARYGDAKLGRETRLYLLKLRVVDSIGRAQGLEPSAAEIEKMITDIEKDVIASGEAQSMQDYLERSGVSREEFLKSLRLGLIQTKLARLGLGIPEGQPVSGEQQEMWLTDQISERGLEEFPAPWTDGIVLRNGDVELLRDEFITFLRGRVDPIDVRECLYELIRVKRMRARMPDVDPKVIEKAIEGEIGNRSAEVLSNPKYKGLTYEQLLKSQGIQFDTWHEDPNVVQAALSRLWVERSYNEEDLREVYENERAYFDGEYGEALEASVLFLRALKTPNDLIRLNHDQAEEKLNQLALEITSRVSFESAVEQFSEDLASRKRKGHLGWVTRTGASGPSPARSSIFAAYDSKAYKPTDPENSLTRLVGPIRTTSGVLLLWVGQQRPKPSWNSMIVYVHRTLRQRFLDESLDPKQVVTYLQETP
jgi:hypothetical protein